MDRKRNKTRFHALHSLLYNNYINVAEVFKLPHDRFYTNVNIQITIIATVSRGRGNLPAKQTVG